MPPYKLKKNKDVAISSKLDEQLRHLHTRILVQHQAWQPKFHWKESQEAYSQWWMTTIPGSQSCQLLMQVIQELSLCMPHIIWKSHPQAPSLLHAMILNHWYTAAFLTIRAPTKSLMMVILIKEYSNLPACTKAAGLGNMTPPPKMTLITFQGSILSQKYYCSISFQYAARF